MNILKVKTKQKVKIDLGGYTPGSCEWHWTAPEQWKTRLETFDLLQVDPLSDESDLIPLRGKMERVSV